MVKIVVILLIALICEAVGVVFLSKGLKQIGEVPKNSLAEMLIVVRMGVTNVNILIGVAFEAAFFAGLLVLLAKHEVSLVWPLTSLGFVLTTLAAKLFLHEEVSLVRWLGVGLIVIGAGMITWTEKKEMHSAETHIPPGHITGG